MKNTKNVKIYGALDKVIDIINEERSSKGLNPLGYNDVTEILEMIDKKFAE